MIKTLINNDKEKRRSIDALLKLKLDKYCYQYIYYLKKSRDWKNRFEELINFYFYGHAFHYITVLYSPGVEPQIY